MNAGQGDPFEGIARGESEAFSRLAAPYRAELERFAARTVGGDPSLAEEVVQESLLRAYRSLRAGARPENVRAWLYAIVRNCALNALRDRRTALPLPEERAGAAQDPAAAEVEQREWMDWLMGAIGALPPRQRDALVASAFEGRSQLEIAGTLGTSVAAVKTLLHRARRALEAAQPSSPALLPGALVVLAKRAAGHTRTALAAKIGTKGVAAGAWQLFVVASVVSGVALVVHGGAGPVAASALPRSRGSDARPASSARPAVAADARRRTPASPSARVRPEARRALRECGSGRRLSRSLTSAALRYAVAHMPASYREYTECDGIFSQALLRRAPRRRAPHRSRR